LTRNSERIPRSLPQGNLQPGWASREIYGVSNGCRKISPLAFFIPATN